jgi:thiol-disulfide isomerase/thioredoxin
MSTGGVLAGQVIDSFSQRQANTAILVSEVGRDEQPREISANDQGYFMVQGLKHGQAYRLQARTKRGEVLLGGSTIATASNVVIVIRVSEGLVPESSPPPGIRGGRGPMSRSQGDPAWAPHAAQQLLQDGDRGSAQRAPAVAQPVVPANSTVPIRPEMIGTRNGTTPPLAQIPGVPWPGSVPTPDNTPTPPTSGSIAACSVRENRVEELILNDVYGQPFQLSSLKSPLVLIDFWGTWCPACVQGMPHLTDLQRRYGSRGLQVIGIAYEDGTLAEQRERVNFIRTRQGVNYKLLLGEGERCPIRTQLGVEAFPTLFLLDQTGRIVWTGEGLTSQGLARLESEVRRRLGEP